MTNPAHTEIERVARLSYGRLVAVLAVRTGSVAAAADALSDALLAALENWPLRGIPERPEAWLIAVARNRATDARRHAKVAAMAEAHLDMLAEERASMERGEMEQSAMPDRLLSLMFVCAHPAIDVAIRTPLMLQLVLGLDARRMAGALLIPPGTLGQRLTRARAKIEKARIGFALPRPKDMATRLRHVLDAIYAAYTIGSHGEGAGDAKSASLAREALWLISVLASQMPLEAEAQALFALILYSEARRAARAGSDGRFVPLEEQDAALWDARMMADADAALRLAARNSSLGRYQIEAAIQAAHADRRHGRPTDWSALAHLYRGLVALHPTIGARTALAAALGEHEGPQAGLAELDRIDPVRIVSYQPWWAVRAHLLVGAGDADAASTAYDRAIALSSDGAIRAFLVRRKMEAASRYR